MGVNEMHLLLIAAAGIGAAAVILILQIRLLSRAPSVLAKVTTTLICITAIWVAIPVFLRLITFQLSQLPGILMTALVLLLLLMGRILL